MTSWAYFWSNSKSYWRKKEKDGKKIQNRHEGSIIVAWPMDKGGWMHTITHLNKHVFLKRLRNTEEMVKERKKYECFLGFWKRFGNVGLYILQKKRYFCQGNESYMEDEFCKSFFKLKNMSSKNFAFISIRTMVLSLLEVLDWLTEAIAKECL